MRVAFRRPQIIDARAVSHHRILRDIKLSSSTTGDDLRVAVVITASEPSWIAPFTGLSPLQFGKLITALRRRGADLVRKGRPWSLPLEYRSCWSPPIGGPTDPAPTGTALRGFEVRSRPHHRPAWADASTPPKRFRKDTVLIVDGTLVPTCDHTIAEQSKNYRYSTNHQVVIEADTRLVVAVGRPVPGKPQRLQGMGALRRERCRRQDHRHRGRRLPRHRPGHPAPTRMRPDRTTRLERGTQRLPPQGPHPRRARLRPHEGMEDPPRLPPDRAMVCTTPCSGSPACTTSPSPGDGEASRTSSTSVIIYGT